MTTGTWILLVAVVAAVAFGLWRGYADGRFRGTHAVRGAGDQDQPDDEGSVLLRSAVGELGERGTLVQFSSSFCAPCRATRVVLADVVSRTEGVRHVEIDAEHHLELVRHLGVLRTPTTLVLDARGVELSRAVGAPTRAQVEATVAAL